MKRARRRAKPSSARIAAIITPACLLTCAGNAALAEVLNAPTFLTGEINGNRGQGLIVQSGSLTVSDATLLNFRTVGGSGSGGGGGLGGAIFVNSGSSVLLNNVQILGNSAVGGLGGTTSLTGGAMNGMPVPITGAAGANGRSFEDNAVLFGDGRGNGMPGTMGSTGQSPVVGAGGNGGGGGWGTDGWSENPLMITAVANASVAQAAAAADLARAIAAVAAASAELASAGANPLTASLVPALTAALAEKQMDLALATANAATAGVDLGVAAANLATWNAANNRGDVGLGGDGGQGGLGGNGSFGFGGGAGGGGGLAGLGAAGARDGVGGAGGQGGMGGFGAGGGRGGDGGVARVGSDSIYIAGAAGAGGQAGFGAGAGSSGVGFGTPTSTGGGGGAGLGGAIFVRDGGHLRITGNAYFNGNGAIGGSSRNGGAAGDSAGTDMFIMPGADVVLAAGRGNTITFNGSISDTTKPKDYALATEGPVDGAGLVIESGRAVFNGTNTYSGATILRGGALFATDGVGLAELSNLTFDGGVYETSGSFTRYLGTENGRVSWAGSGGFAAAGGDLTVTLNEGRTVRWADDSFVPVGHALIFGSDNADGRVTFTNDIDLNGTTGTFMVRTNGGLSPGEATLTGVLANGSLRVNGPDHDGRLILTAAHTYAGTTTVDGGTLVLREGGSIAASLVVTVNTPGTLDITAEGAALRSLAGGGTVQFGEQTLTITDGSSEFAGTLAGTGRFAVAGGTQAIGGTIGHTGETAVGAGATLAIRGAGSIAASSGLVNDGILDIAASDAGVSITRLSGTGSVALGARQLTVTEGDTAFDGTIGGTGRFAVAGGTQTLTGVNTHTGGTLVQNATLVVNGDTALGGDSGTVTLDNGTLRPMDGLVTARGIELANVGTVDTNGKAISLSGELSGTGGLKADGGGTLTLTGNNSFSGGTLITGGTTLAITADSALGASTASLLIESGKLLALGDLVSIRPITIEESGVIDSNGFALSLNGPITLAVAEVEAPLFSGTAAVEGRLLIDGEGLTLPEGTRLRGVGTVATSTTVQGTLAPGNSPGTLTFLAPVTMAAGSTLSLDIDGTGTGTGAGNYSRVVVLGENSSFTAGGGTLQPVLRGITGSASNTYTPPLTQSFAVVQAEGGVFGSFDELLQPADGLAPNTRFDALYGRNALTLHVTPVAYGDLAPFGVTFTDNQQGVAEALDALRPTPGLRADADTTEALRTLYAQVPAAMPAVIDRLSATIYGDALMASLGQSRAFGEAIAEQAAARRGAVVDPKTVIAEGERYTSWATGVGQWLDVDADDDTSSYRSSAGGVAVGTDMRLGQDLVAGIAAGHVRGSTDSADTGANADTNTTHLAAYGSWNGALLFVDGQVGLTYADVDTERDLGVFGITAKGDGKGWGTSAALEAGVRYALGGWRFQPSAGLRVDRVARDRLEENGAGALSLDVDDDAATGVRSTVGLRTETSFSLGGGYKLTPSARLHWVHELGDVDTTTSAAFVGAEGAEFRQETAESGRDGVLAGAGISLTLPVGFDAFASYNADLRQDTTARAVTAGIRFTW